MIDTTKLRIPVGSLVVDLSMVLFLAWAGGRLVEKLDQIDKRVAKIETAAAAQNTDARLMVLEQRAAQAERDRTEILDALHRIETKLDSKVDKR